MAGKVKALQEWCRQQCDGYRDVSITNMTSSWKSGLAFCAIIHRHRPDLIDYNSLSKENVYENNQLAFTVGETIGIPALLDAEDMVAMATPDKLCIVTYVAQYYNVFRDKAPAGGPSKTVQAVKRPSTDFPPSRPPESKKPTPKENQTLDTTGAAPQQKSRAALGRRGTYGENCALCGAKVYLLERHIDGSALYHRRCFRTSQRAQPKARHTDLHSTQPAQTRNKEFLREQDKNSRDVEMKDSVPKNGQPKAENAADRIAKLLSEREEPRTKATASKNLLLLGHTSSAYKPVNTDTSVASWQVRAPSPKRGPGSNLLSGMNASARPETASTGKASGTKTSEISKSTGYTSTSTGSSSAGSVGAGSTAVDIDTSSRGAQEKPTTATSKPILPENKSGESTVVSGLLQSLAQVRKTEQATSPRDKSLPVQEMDKSFASKSGAHSGHVRSPVNPKCKYLDISKQNDVSASVPSESAMSKSLTPSSGPTVLTVASTSIASALSKNVSSVNAHAEPSSVSSSSQHSPLNLSKQGGATGPSYRPSAVKMTERHFKQPKSILKVKTAHPAPDKVQDVEIDWTTAVPTLKTARVGKPSLVTQQDVSLNETPTQNPVIKSILKKRDPDKKSGQSVQNSTSTNEITGFKVTDSVEMRKHSSGNEISNGVKPDWMVEAEKRQKVRGGKYVDPEKRSKVENTAMNSAVSERPQPKPRQFIPSNLQSKVLETNHTKQEKWTSTPNKAEGANGENGPSNRENRRNMMDTRKAADDLKPEWMREAERRIAERNGRYVDPEKPLGRRGLDRRDGSGDVLSPARSQPPPRPTTSPQLSPGSTVSSSLSPLSSPRTSPFRPNVPPQISPRPGQQQHDAEPQKAPVRPTSPAVPSVSPVSPTSPVSSPSPVHKIGGTTFYISAHPQPSPKSPVSAFSAVQNSGGASSGVNSQTGPVSPRRVKRPAPPVPTHLPLSPTAHSHSADRRLIPAPASSTTSPLNSPQRRPMKKISVVEDFEFSSFEASTDWDAINLHQNGGVPGQRSPIYYPSSESSGPTPPPVPPKHLGDSDVEDEELSPTSARVRQIQNRPLPPPPPPLRSPGFHNCSATKRAVQAENRLSFTDLGIQLEELDKQLRILEDEGRRLEDVIRSTTEAMDEDELMVQWFELINAKNDLVRKEAELMYRQRQQELEVLHEELEYELRCLMEKPERLKTSSEKVREASLLQELLDTVSQRNLIVDSIEEDRIRYIEEDEEIANMMAIKGFSKETPQKNKKKKKKDKKKKS